MTFRRAFSQLRHVFRSLLHWRSRWRSMRESEQHFRLLIDGVADYAIFMLDPQGMVKSWSVAAENMFLYKAEEIQGRHFSCLYPEGARAHHQPEDELRMAMAHARFEDTGWRVRKDGSQFWANSVICPLSDDEGQLRGFSNVTRDISERRQAEMLLREKDEELYQARKMEAIGRLAGGVAHDFNNLMTGIVGLSEDLCNELSAKDPRRADLEEILKAAYRATALTRQLLTFGRRQVAAPQVIHINTVIADFEKMLRRLVGADIELVIRPSDDLRPIRMDPTHLEQVLVNLVMNARDAMPRGGTITISASRSFRNETEELEGGLPAGSYVMLSIADNGAGMDPEIAKRIFEPFFTTKSQGKGTGLGLATVYGIVKQSRGDIRVVSQIGAGTTFFIYLPEVLDAPSVSAVTPNQGLTPKAETVLLVEDEAIVRHSVSRALERFGYRLLVAPNGAQAMEIFKAHRGRLDLLLTDVVMPGMNGRELAEWICKRSPETAVLYMSGYAEDIIVRRGIVEPGIHLIEKSFTREMLAAKVREVLEEKKQELAHSEGAR